MPQKKKKNYPPGRKPPRGHRDPPHLNILKEALAHHLAQDFDRALAAYDRAIAMQPDFAVTHSGRGSVLQAAGRFEDALAAFDRAITLDPVYADAHYHRGDLLQKSGKYAEALAAFDRAVALKPDVATAHNDRAAVLHALGKHEEAQTAWRRAVALKPAYAEAHYNQGLALRQAGRYEEALAALDRAIALKPTYINAHFNRGLALKQAGRHEEAVSAFDQTIALKPDFAEAHFNRGFSLQELTRYEEALRTYDKALALKTDYPAVLWNKSLLLLLRGDFAEGWRLYEWRHAVMKQFVRHFHEPLLSLDREDPKGRTVLLYAEQGLGDTIQMLRYVPLLAARGFRIIVEVPASLLTLSCGLSGVALLVPHGKTLPDFDLQCPFMSLPLVFKTTVETIPSATPYLKAPPDKKAFWQDRLGVKTRPRIGLVWSGSHQHENDRERSIPLATLLPLLNRNAEFYSLQKEYRQTDTEALMLHQKRLRDYSKELDDFGDTAALIDEMDLVISVDTAAAHLACALGKPVWILLPYAVDFRWFTDREDSPWYPTARLFRQPAFHAWKPVVEKLDDLLKNYLLPKP